MICIWCKNDFAKLSLEHGIPEGLACPPDLELRDVACTACNNGLSRVDRALLKQFEALTVMYGVPRKRGRSPTINSWQAIRSSQRPDGPHISINGGPGIVEAEGRPLRPASKANGITDVWVKPETGQLGFSQEFGNDPLFLPALYKIGLNLVAKHFGAAEAASDRYDHVRAFVLRHPGAVMLTAALADNSIFAPVTEAAVFTKPGRPFPMFRVTILGVTFLLDMAPDQVSLRDLRGAAMLHDEPFYLFPKVLAA
jgi:hypothetical protein